MERGIGGDPGSSAARTARRPRAPRGPKVFPALVALVLSAIVGGVVRLTYERRGASRTTALRLSAG